MHFSFNILTSWVDFLQEDYSSLSKLPLLISPVIQISLRANVIQLAHSLPWLLWLCASAAAADTGKTLEEKLAQSDPEFLQFLKDEGSSDMLGWAADDLSTSSSDEADDDINDDGDCAQKSSDKVKKSVVRYLLFVLSTKTVLLQKLFFDVVLNVCGAILKWSVMQT